MNIEKGRLTGIQVMWATCCFIQATVLRSVFVISVAGRDSWLMAITGFLCFAPIAAVYAVMLRWFPQKNLFEINEKVFGKIAGKAVSAIYLFFFITLSALNLRDVGTFVVDFVMLDTPEIAVLILFAVFCVYAVRKGVEGFIRVSTIFPFIGFAIVLLNFGLVLKDVKWGFLQPVLAQEPMKYIQATHITATIPLGELIVMLMLAPNIRKGEKAGKFLFFGALVSAVFMFIVILRDIVTLGPLAEMVSLPSFEAVRTVNLKGVITRTESLYAFLMTALMYFKVCILFYASSLGIAQILGLKEYKPLVCVMAALIVGYSTFVYNSTIENGFWGTSIAPFPWLFFEYILPALTLLVARLRKQNRPQKAEVSTA